MSSWVERHPGLIFLLLSGLVLGAAVVRIYRIPLTSNMCEGVPCHCVADRLEPSPALRADGNLDRPMVRACVRWERGPKP